MFNTPGTVKKLRQYYKDKLAVPDVGSFIKELTGESDRAFVILVGSLLDDVLIFRLSHCLAFSPDEAQYDHVFRFEGPLGTFSARIEIAYIFGFIDKLTRDQLEIVREMRNACAHSKHHIGFDLPQLANVAKRVLAPTGMTFPRDDTRVELRRAFYTEFLFLYHILTQGSREKGVAIVKESLAGSGVAVPLNDKPPKA